MTTEQLELPSVMELMVAIKEYWTTPNDEEPKLKDFAEHVQKLIARTELELLNVLEEEKNHGAWCIDDDCMDEDHMYWYVPLEAITQARNAIKEQ